MEFGPKLLEQLVDEIKAAGYSFRRLDEPAQGGKNLWLRWDVDISPAGAFAAGNLLHQQGVRSNFFFQLNADTYSPFSPELLGGIARLQEQGHCVGLHFDQEHLGEDEATLTKTLDWFDSCCTPVDRVASFHRPTPTVLGRSYQGFLNAYSSEFFDPERYLSDSRRSLEFVPRLRDWLSQGRHPLQLLLHPAWWEPLDSPRAIWKHLSERRQKELEDYVRRSFRKVFTPVLDAEEE